MEVCKLLMNNVNTDMSNGIVAVWHDESHWNSYLINNPDSYKELDSPYCYPEGWGLTTPQRITSVNKNNKEFHSL